MKKEIFGEINGEKVHKYTITNGRIWADLIDYGARLQSLKLRCFDGTVKDVVLGFNTIEEYVQDNGYLGATVGRVANRIGKGRFVLNGKEYKLPMNDGENCLHGGVSGFDSKIWGATATENSVSFNYVSADGEEGFPAELKVSVTYTVTDCDELKIEYYAISDGDTIVSLTNHGYFNLNGEGGEKVFTTKLFIDADSVISVDSDLIADGTFKNIKGTVYDFTTMKEIGDYTESKDAVLSKFGCYDVCYALNGKGYRKIAGAKSEESGITMEVFSDMEGVQLYTEAILNGRKGKNCIYGKGSAFCLETQHFPNAINCPDFPSPILKMGDKYQSVTTYKFKF